MHHPPGTKCAACGSRTEEGHQQGQLWICTLGMSFLNEKHRFFNACNVGLISMELNIHVCHVIKACHGSI